MHSTWIHWRTGLLIVLAISLIGDFIGAQPIMLAPADLKWVDAPPSLPPRAKVALIHGDPTKAGLYAICIKFPADYKIAPHRHPVDSHATVLSGALYSGAGEKFEPEKGKAWPAGSFLITPAQTPHFVWTKEETVVQEYGIGPTDTTYVNPADDPRKR